MHTEARKLHIIEVVLKTQSDAVLEALEMIVDSNLIAPGESTTPISVNCLVCLHLPKLRL